MNKNALKLFVKKYWIYLVAGILIIVLVSFSYAYWGGKDNNQSDYSDNTTNQYDSNGQDELGNSSDLVSENIEDEENSLEDDGSEKQIVAKQKSSQNSSDLNVQENSDPDTSSSDPKDEPDPEPVPESPSAYVAFYADNQSDSDEDDARHANVVNRIISTGANPVLHAGDIMEDGTQNSFDRFINVAGTLLNTRTFYSALGNNDRLVGDSGTPSPILLNYFHFPNNEKWYSINTGNLHAVILDSAFSASDPTQLSWLTDDLQSSASQERITVVIFHHPTFVSSVQSYLINYGVDFVICGHIHIYSKTNTGGVDIFTLPGGTSLEHATATVYSNYADLRFYNLNGSLIETVRVSER